MKRLSALVLAIIAAPPAIAANSDAPYYGPALRWHGIGFKTGYEDHIEKDGSWRIEVSARSGEPVDMALYRAAERARDLGYRYVALLGGVEHRTPGMRWVTLYARPSATPDAPTGCRSHRKGACYTAEVGEVLRVLGGPDGAQPGVAVADHFDRFGRPVMISGYGIGAVGSMAAMPVSAPLPPVPVVATRPSAATPSQADEADARFDAALRAQRPVRRDPRQGWTVSD